MNKNIVLGIVAFLILVLVGVGTYRNLGSKNIAKEGKVVKVGVNLPFTGFLALYGNDIKEGINLAALDYLDSLEKDNLRIDFDFQDNEGEANNAVTIFQKHQLTHKEFGRKVWFFHLRQ